MALKRFERGMENKLRGAQFMASDRLNRQQLAKQNALQDIGRQQAEIGLRQSQRGESFRNALAQDPRQAQADFPLLHAQAFPQSKLTGIAKNLSIILGRNPTLQEMTDYKKSGAQNINIGGMQQTKGRTKTDEAYAKEYVTYKASGGFADQMKQLNQIQGVLVALESGKELTGPVTGSVPDVAQKFLNPEAIRVREDVEEVVQRNLRAVLGAQFTEREGDRLIKRAYNPNLSESENAKRVRRLLIQMKKATKAKESAARYWEKKGTLTGWGGKMPTMEDFNSINFGKEPKAQKPAIKFIGFE